MVLAHTETITYRNPVRRISSLRNPLAAVPQPNVLSVDFDHAAAR